MIKRALGALKGKKLFVYLFMTIAVLSVATSSTLGAVPSEGLQIPTSSAVTASAEGTAAEIYSAPLDLSKPLEESAAEGDLSSIYDSPVTYNAAISNMDALQSIGMFTFARWATISVLPVPDIGFGNIGSIVTASMISLANMLFVVSSIALMALGLLLILIMRLDILGAFIPTIDWFFASITGDWLFKDNATSLSPLFVGVALMIIAIVFRLSPLASRDRSLLGDVIISAIAVGALITMSSASQNNWDNTDKYSVDVLSDGKIPFGAVTPESVKLSDANSYAPWSFGFVLTFASASVDNVVGMISEVVSAITGSIESAATGGGSSSVSGLSAGSDCGYYVNGMHRLSEKMLAGSTDEIAFGGAAAKSIAAYDNLVYNVLYKPAAQAAYGRTASGAATWCRMWEATRGSDPVEQAVIAREGGMYSWVIGGKAGGSNPMTGLMLDADGNYTSLIPDGQGKAALAGFFGNTISTSKASAAFKFYWAACSFTKESIKLSPAFVGVKGTEQKGDNRPDGGTGQDLENHDCRDIPALYDGTGGFAFGAKFNDGGDMIDTGEASKSMERLSNFAWTPGDELFSFGPLGISITAEIGEQLANTNVTGDGALNFFKMVYGSSSAMVWPAALVALVGTVMMAVGLLPMQLGALVLQVISVVALITFPLVLIILIIPAKFGRRALATIAKLFVSSKLIQMVFVIFISLVISIINLLNIVFGAVLGSTFLSATVFAGDGTPLGTFLGAILNALAIGVAFKATQSLMKQVFKADVGTIKGSMQVGQNMASSAVSGASMRELGLGQFKPMGGGGGAGAFGQGQKPNRPTPDDNRFDPANEGPKTRQKDKEKTESPTSTKPKSDTAKPDIAGAAAPIVLGADGVPTAGTDNKTIGKDLAKLGEDGEKPNASQPEAPVADDRNLTEEERLRAEQATQAVQNASGVSTDELNNKVAEQSSADLESQLDDNLASGDEQGVANTVNEMGSGATAMIEGNPENMSGEEIEQNRKGYFDGDVNNEERPVDRGEKRGAADMHATALENIHGDADGVGRVDNNVVPEASRRETSLGSEESAPGFSDRPVGNNGRYNDIGSGTDMSGVLGGISEMSGDISRNISGLKDSLEENLDSFGRVIEESTIAQAAMAEESLEQNKLQTKATENLTQAISSWFTKKN